MFIESCVTLSLNFNISTAFAFWFDCLREKSFTYIISRRVDIFSPYGDKFFKGVELFFCDLGFSKKILLCLKSFS